MATRLNTDSMKKLGFWMEEGYPDTPSIYDYIDSRLSKDRKIPWFLYFYLQNSPRVVTSFSLQESILDKDQIRGETIRTDGVWVWSDTVMHYYRNNGLVLPEDFIRHVKRRIIPYPWLFALKVLFSKGQLITNVYKTLVDDFGERQSDTPPQ